MDDADLHLAGSARPQVRDGLEALRRRIAALRAELSEREQIEALVAELTAAHEQLARWHHSSLPEALVRLAALSTSRQEMGAILPRAAAVCQDALGARVTLSINAGSPDAPTSLASTSQVAQGVDGAQVSHGEGPCVSAFQERRTIVSADLSTDPRWPAFSRDPHVRDVGGAIAVPVHLGDRLLGALNAYGDVGDPPAPHLVAAVEMLAAVVAACFYEIAERRELADAAAGLEQALVSRATIDQAKGIIMAERHCTADQAFDHLVELSSTRNRKLRDVAQELVEQRSATSEGPRS